jgi:hypothetical protein
LFGSYPLKFTNLSKNGILESINADVVEYQEWLNANMDVTLTVASFIEQTLNI